MREEIILSFFVGQIKYSVHKKYSSNGTRKRSSDKTRIGEPMPRLRMFLSRVDKSTTPHQCVEVRLSGADERSYEEVLAVHYASAQAWAEAQAAWAEGVIESKPHRRAFTIPKGQQAQASQDWDDDECAGGRAARFLQEA